MRNFTRAWLSCCVGCFLRASLPAAVFLAVSLTAASSAADKPIAQIVEEVGISPPPNARLPLGLAFVDADGRTTRLADAFSDRPVILHLVYYQCPMLCKLSSDGLLRSLSTLSLRLGKDFSIVTVSFDPREGPELSARARQVAIERCGLEAVEKGWTFLTGDQTSIAELCKAVGFRYHFNETNGQFAHASGVFVFTSGGTLSRYLSGVDFSPRDLRLAVVEAAAGKVGTAADQVLLMCYMYDPTTGKYGLAIMTAIRAAGIVTVGGMAFGIYTMLRRDKQRQLSRHYGLDVGGLSEADGHTFNKTFSASETPPTE